LLAVLLPSAPPTGQPDGHLLYQQHCAVCHGVDGGGGVGIPLNLPDFLAVASDDYMRSTLREGRPGRVMPAFPNFDDAEIQAIAEHIRGWSDQPTPQYDSDSIEASAERGKAIYSVHCASCHGKNGGGGSGTGITFSRPRGAPVMAPALNNIGFQRSVSDAMLKATLLRGRQGTPMPSITALGLTDEDANALVAHIRQLANGFSYSQAFDLEPLIRFESAYDLEQTLVNLKQAVVGRNFRIIREQYLESGLVSEGEENRKQVILYFCNFAFLNDALALDPRVGLFLPCRVTVLETAEGVIVTTINPKSLSQLFNNSELDDACEQMHSLYTDIMEEATL
jgi:cytochrome c oxidase cbb3-type subunit 3